MALITSRATVHIPIYVRVLEVRGVIAAMFVAIRARELRVVTRNQVAGRALAICVAMTGGKARVVAVRERPGCPVDRANAVASPALCGGEESGVRGGRMRRTGRAVVVALMAGYARVAIQTVIVVDVAVGA